MLSWRSFSNRLIKSLIEYLGVGLERSETHKYWMRKWIDLFESNAFGPDFDHEGWSEHVDLDFEQDLKPARLPATPENIERAKRFVMNKWVERAKERHEPKVPIDLSNACKFSSMFAREIFGGRLRGNQAHQFVQLADGKIVDLNSDARDVLALGDNAQHHDEELFWGNPDHVDALDSCRPRVKLWVKEFLGQSVKADLSEGWLATTKVGEHQVDLFTNPSRSEWAKLFRDYPQGLRGHVLRDDGSVVVWDAMHAVHTDIDRYLTSQGHRITCGYRYFFPDRIEFNDIHMETNDEDLVNDAGEVTHYGWYLRETFDTTITNRSIISFYGNPPKIIGIDATLLAPVSINAEWIKINCAICAD